MSPGPLVVSFVGPSGVGKTTLIERLIPLLRVQGLRVGTAKHAPHGYDVLDKPGSDSSRHAGAGADAVLLFGSHGAVVFLAADPDDGAPQERGSEQEHGQHHRGGSPVDALRLARLGELVDRHLAHLDVVITEGFAPINDVLVAVQRESVPPKRPIDPDEVWFRVSDVPTDDSLGFDQLDEVAARIVHRVESRRGGA